MRQELIKVAQVTLKILSKKSWNSLSISEVKQKSKIKIFDNEIKNKHVLLRNINAYFDHDLSLSVRGIEQSNRKDMIFEIIMMRFDILQKNRKALQSIFNSFKSKPQELIFLLPYLLDSMILMANYANISVRGLRGQLRLKGILIIYCSTFLIWMKDDSTSLEKTMTSLDSYLNKAGSILKFFQ